MTRTVFAPRATGCLGAYTSNLATLSRYLGQELSSANTRRVLQKPGLTIDEIISRSSAGEERARNALHETARYLGLGLAIIINALNPARIHIGGEITAAWDELAPMIEEAIASRRSPWPVPPRRSSRSRRVFILDCAVPRR